MASFAQIIRYGMAGTVATTTHYALLLLFSTVLGLPAILATTVGAVGGAVTGYLTNARWTFAGDSRSGGQFTRYLVVAGCAVIANALLLAVLHDSLVWPLWPAQASVTLLLFFSTFVLNRNWSFA